MKLLKLFRTGFEIVIEFFRYHLSGLKYSNNITASRAVRAKHRSAVCPSVCLSHY